MSAYNIKAKVLQDRDASPPVQTNPEQGQGVIKSAFGVQRTSESGASLPTAGSQYRMFQIPSNARLDRLEYAVDDVGTTQLDITVWYPTKLLQGGQNAVAKSSEAALISSSLFATAIANVDGGRAWANGFAAASPSLNLQGQQLWQMLGLANDPGVELDMGFTMRTACASNGYIGLRASYVD